MKHTKGEFADCRDYLDALEKAINNKDKEAILSLYEHDVNLWDWNDVPEFIGERYDELIEKAEPILGL